MYKARIFSRAALWQVKCRVRHSTRQSLPSLMLGLRAACSACALVVTDDSKKLRRPHRLALRRPADPARNIRLQFLTCHSKKEEGKDTPSEKSVPACEVPSTPQRIAFTHCAYGWGFGCFRYISLRADYGRLQKAPSSSVRLHSISPAPYAQPPLA